MANSNGLTMVIFGCGMRGRTFAKIVKNNPQYGRVVAIAEPIAERRNKMAELCQVPAENCFSTWQELLAKPKMADVAILTLMDREHIASALKAMDMGYHLMLEKPMATSLEE